MSQAARNHEEKRIQLSLDCLHAPMGSLLQRHEYLSRMAVPSQTQTWVSVIVPIKDERDNLVPLTEQLIKVLDACDESRSALFEILFIDDGSTDGSSDVLDQLAADDPRVRVFHFDRNYGQSSALDAGFKHSVGALVITIDGDLQNDPADIATLLPYVKTFDLVCGWRTIRHDSLVRMLSSRMANAVRSAVTDDRVHDTGCSLKIFRRAVVDTLQVFNGMHRFFPALALMHGFTIIEVPVRHYPRIHGLSKYGVGNRLFKGLYDLFAVRWMQTRVLRYRILPK
jgi:glycosyltransferase involved in cell wall biosynthesis